MTDTLVNSRCSLAYITNIPTPYRVEMVETWARINPQLAISVFYTDMNDQGRGWSTRPIEGVTENRLKILGKFGRYGKLNRGIFDLIRTHDVIMIGGFEQASYLVAALLAKLMGKPVILLFDGFSPARFGTEWLPILCVKRITAALCDVYFANGEVGRRYLVDQIRIAKDKPIFNQYLSHSDRYISLVREQVAGLNKRDLQMRLGLDTERQVLLSCGYLIPRKRIDLIIEAISNLPEQRRPLLLIVGMGPLEGYLKQIAEKRGVPIHFAGFKQQAELAAFYFAADALVLSSDDDPWGLVVNEAMSAGLPVIISDACGAALDLVREGENGFVFPNLDVAALTKVIGKLLDSNMVAMGAASSKIIQDWTAEHSAKNLGRCMAAVAGEPIGSALDVSSSGSSRRGAMDILVLHEREGKKYMEALCRLSDNSVIGQVDFISASVFRKFIWDVYVQRRRLNYAWQQAMKNLVFRLSFRKLTGKTILLGVAPWDYRFLLYQNVRKRNRLIYHTSWPHWEGTFVPRTYGFITSWLRKHWLAVLAQENVEIVAVTETAAISLGKLLPEKKINVIPHVVSEAFYLYRAKYATPFRLLFVGELSRKKGIFLLPSLLDVLEEYNCSLDIVGDGPDSAFVRQMVESRSNVTWHGLINDRVRLAEIMSLTQLLLVPSQRNQNWEELFGMVIAEAMAVGLPIVASQHVGPSSIIKDGVTGYLVADESIDGFADRVAFLIRNADAWQLFSDAAREQSTHYQLDKIKKLWKQLLIAD